MAESLKPTILRLEAEIHDGFHRLCVYPKDNTSEALASLDTLYHALMSSMPKRGKYIVGTSGFVVDVKTDDTENFSAV